ncbi:superoxide dismutase [Cu-Zn]-like isoform X2 [Hydra vulgaris]|uniref:superoxide dismutase [Cu-Zn]-like isoform X2 n=1 Tax=Hydra vulgaris TaxID=6087 RepID=UPI001F5EBEFD|nr:superoxide dismutase [Cu-Zn]-like isoform X2 [Hydra vulgaris]
MWWYLFAIALNVNCAPVPQEDGNVIKRYPYIVRNENRIVALVELQGNNIKGEIWFDQSYNDATYIEGYISGVSPGKHGFHIHEFGKLSDGCKDAGAHYNPLMVNHGGNMDKVRHIGDLGNIDVGKDGVVQLSLKDTVVNLFGNYSVIGRTLVVHLNEDDLGKADNEESKKTGNAGPRIACGIIKRVMHY